MSKARILAAPPPQVIEDTNLSRAWARLLLQVLDNAGTEVAPLILSLSGFAENAATAEDPAVRQTLDRLLELKDRIVVEKVAFTIFPQRLWEISRGDRNRLFARLWQAIAALVIATATGVDIVSVQFPQKRASFDASTPIRFTPTPTRASMGANRI